MRSLRLIEAFVATVLVAAGLVALIGGSAASEGGVAIAVVAAGSLAAWVASRRVAAWGYAERADDLLVKRGILVRRLSVIPYGRMQFVDVTAGPFERLFGLATVRLHTAAAASDVRVPGLRALEAGRLRDRLTELGEARAAGL